MLLQSGFEFPWDEDLLIQRRLVFGSSDLPRGMKVQVGRSEGWVWFRLGRWTFAFAINVEGRFPPVEEHIRDVQDAAAAIQIDPNDAAFLARSMKRLPGNETAFSPVTVDANGSIAVRANSEDTSQSVELLLARSTRSGLAQRFNSDRTLLRRALDLGFREIHVFAPDQPLLCVNDRRKYLWAVLTPDDAVKPSPDMVQISSISDEAADSPKTNQPQQETAVTNPTQTSSQPSNQSTRPSSTEELIEAAEQLKASLRDTLGKTNELIVGLKRHRKEAKIVRTTLDSLRQLQPVG